VNRAPFINGWPNYQCQDIWPIATPPLTNRGVGGWLGLGLRSLRKYRKFTVITGFVPYKSGFLTVNLQHHVRMTNQSTVLAVIF
jgi:hypothetical protein